MSGQITFDDLTVKLKDRVLYQNLNFSIDEGMRYVFLGPNGIGKSLLLELVFLGHNYVLASKYKGLQVSGRILNSKGEDLLDPSTKRTIAYVAQNENFYKGMTIKQICETSCMGVGIELDEDRLDELLKAFGIYEKKNLKIKNNVSFGEGKIIHIISRLLKLSVTNILLLDEPLNHLSFKNSKVFNELIFEEVRKNDSLVVIMVSHCRAVNFTDQAMVYITESKNIVFRPYQSYDCFSNGKYEECF